MGRQVADIALRRLGPRSAGRRGTHIVLGLGGIIVLGWTQTSPGRALVTALAFFSVAVVISVWWSRRFANGPLEIILRRTGQGKTR